MKFYAVLPLVAFVVVGAEARVLDPAPSRETMVVTAVLSPGAEQHVVLLRTQREPHRYLPIWIGQNEAMAIQLRLDA
jgi:hypothetical protein